MNIVSNATDETDVAASVATVLAIKDKDKCVITTITIVIIRHKSLDGQTYNFVQ